MTILQAIILGIVQGLTEFIPVSSTAHLVFAARLTNLYAGVEQNLRAQQTTATIAVVQLGTLAAVIVYFARDIWNISLSFVRDHWRLLANRRAREAANGPFVGGLSKETLLGWYIIMGTLPISIIGLLFKKEIEGTLTKNLWIIATMLIVIAILLLVAERVGTRRRTMNDLGWRDALIVGCAQVLALIPGASRSGSTIMGGLFAGLTREAAARFSFLLSIPAIFASGLLELREALAKLPPHSFFALAVATVVSGLVGYASIWFLLRYLRTHSTRLFIGYRLALGILLLALLTAGVIDPLGTP
ncbi:MAG: undecaprenyl-diphosphatase UppP [Pyrinomonas sp.]|uniref:undecaprenyl-diphosphatase UppP n=1 Tax=Pyrinomonas sp. TaxID=2080306 RepID=UPI0033268C6C